MQRKLIAVFRRCERSYLRGRMEEYGLNPLEGMVIHQLSLDDGSKQEGLCAALEIEKSQIARAVAHLEERGLVERTVSRQCRREKQTMLTSSGRAMHEKILRIFADWEEICFRGFSQEERALYESLTCRINDNVTANRRGDA